MKALAVFAILFQISLACEFDKKDNSLFCQSFSELKKDEDYSKVKSYFVALKNDYTIKKDDFVRLPDLINFQMKSLNKNKVTIAKDAFKNLKKMNTFEIADSALQKLEGENNLLNVRSKIYMTC